MPSTIVFRLIFIFSVVTESVDSMVRACSKIFMVASDLKRSLFSDIKSLSHLYVKLMYCASPSLSFAVF